FSLASVSRIKLIKNLNENCIYFLNGQPKSDVRIFEKVKKDLNIISNNWIYIDDSPIALRTGKLSGLITIMKVNKIFGEREYKQFISSIDYKVKSFKQIEKIINQVNNHNPRH
ncbi:MAG: hypothetical protein SFU98_11020, partial [Leptospiraceae bacterium]|nr:hypothetical protein [Leptospiraceae bacterium]